MSTESAEDDNFATEEANSAILNALGADKRNKVLAGLYMGRLEKVHAHAHAHTH